MNDLERKPYWVRVLEHFQAKNYISNGLTIPFLIGCRSKIHPIDPPWEIDEFLYQLKLSNYIVTLMTCPNLAHVVIGLMDLETLKVASQGVYRKFGNIYIIDQSFEAAADFDEIVRECTDRYSGIVTSGEYSFNAGKWAGYSATDIERFTEVSMPSIQTMLDRKNSGENPRPKEIRKLHEGGKLKDLVPQWHTSFTSIEIENQPNNLPAVRRNKGLEIIPDVSIEVLLKNMVPQYIESFKEKALFGDLWAENKICRVLDHWLNKERLIPPTMTFEEGLGDKLYPVDGKHRFIVAYCYDAKSIPILIESKDREKVISLLGL